MVHDAHTRRKRMQQQQLAIFNKQAHQQDANPPHVGGQLKLCATPLPSFSRNGNNACGV